MSIVVCPLRFLPQVVAERAPSHLISLLDPDVEIATPAQMDPRRHLRLGLYDVSDPGDPLAGPDEAAVARILEFAREWDAAAPLVVHCQAGISRSTATAFALACERSPGGDEQAIARDLRRRSPQAYPNRRIVALADELLGRRGRMVAAIEAIGGNSFVAESRPFELLVR